MFLRHALTFVRPDLGLSELLLAHADQGQGPQGVQNCSSKGKGVLRITLLTPLYVHVTEYFNCALTFHYAYGPHPPARGGIYVPGTWEMRHTTVDCTVGSAR